MTGKKLQPKDIERLENTSVIAGTAVEACTDEGGGLCGSGKTVECGVSGNCIQSFTNHCTDQSTDSVGVKTS